MKKAMAVLLVMVLATVASAVYLPNSASWEGSYECTIAPSQTSSATLSWETGYANTFYVMDGTYVRHQYVGDGANTWASFSSTSGITPLSVDTTVAGKGFAAEWGFRLPDEDSIGELVFTVNVGGQSTWVGVLSANWEAAPATDTCYVINPSHTSGVWPPPTAAVADGLDHAFQMVFMGDSIEVYLDGVLFDTLATTAGVGDVSFSVASWGRATFSGVQKVDTDYIRWTNNAVPEPMSMALLALGGLLIRRKK